MNDETILNDILKAFGIDSSDFIIQRIGSGHIHQTYKLNGKLNYVLQRVNKGVFKQPEIISSNLRLAADYLQGNFPDYLFLRCVPGPDKKDYVYDHSGYPWRLFPYFENTITVDKVDTTEEAFSAASEFARLTLLLDKIDVQAFGETIPHFHDLGLRYQQFEESLNRATEDRKQKADDCVKTCKEFYPLVEKYRSLVNSGLLKIRIVHNDTKINNILFDQASHQAICVIDLDTLMPGYFIYDLGDMVRTFVSPVNEEEKDFSKIIFREEIYDALQSGYLSQMEEVMSQSELEAIPFAGRMMTYIMALRFVTDYLAGDQYYHTKYPGQNLIRAGNQLRFLKLLENALPSK